ncbi:hypothetical protein ZIOFF_021845 [Zingiber officinale]|uniref:Retrotransposon gag domain-containing protein n=1 Tax=Zingiber officinale TaxID=94328 RepID=A0A8J5H8S1_ZINOF|nr:hypothetical protein ZIOFF_021845 [Zingiber officinale]
MNAASLRPSHYAGLDRTPHRTPISDLRHSGPSVCDACVLIEISVFSFDTENVCEVYALEIEICQEISQVMAGRRNNGDMGGQNNQFLEGLTTLLREQNRIHGEQIQQILQARKLGTHRCRQGQVFYGKYFTVENRTRLARKFLELRQGDLTVAKYVRRFERGRYFVPMITSQPVEELKHFTEGLRSAIRHDVRMSRVTTFREAVDQALMSERDRNDMIKEAQNKRLSYQGRDQQEPRKKKSVPGIKLVESHEHSVFTSAASLRPSHCAGLDRTPHRTPISDIVVHRFGELVEISRAGVEASGDSPAATFEGRRGREGKFNLYANCDICEISVFSFDTENVCEDDFQDMPEGPRME